MRYHHEWWNGSGYPDRLAREAITLAARIIAVAEAYDAMQRNRPYPGRTAEKAVSELQRCAGTQFDPPAVVQTLLVLLPDQQKRKLSLQATA